MNKLNIKAFALSCATLWALATLLVGLMPTLGWSAGSTFTALLDFYPGYTQTPTGALIGTLWAFLDGLIAGTIFAYLYNTLSK